jgi:hypothetical protein
MTLRHAHVAGLLVAAVATLALAPVDYHQRAPPGLHRPDSKAEPSRPPTSGPVIGPGHEAQVLALFADAPRGEAPWRLHAVRIEGDRVFADFADAQGAVGGSLVLRARGLGEAGSASFAFSTERARDDEALTQALADAERSVRAHDGGGFFADAVSWGPPADGRSTGRVAAVALLAWALLLLARERFRPRFPAPVVLFRRTHALPAVLQALLFAYWGLYFPEVWHHLPVLGVLLCFAFAFDVLMAWTLRRPAHVGLAVVPVVLSANLFVWFDGASAWAYFAIVAVALASRAVRRGDTHVFNPSAVAVAAYGVLALALPRAFPYVDVANAFNLPPNQAEVIFLLALLPHLLLDTTPLSAAAALAMVLAHAALGAAVPSPTWPAWLLSITLLAGDPATMPKSAGGRVLFGLGFGLGVGLTGWALTNLGQMDYFAKVLPLPVMNLLVPRFDAWAARLKLPASTGRARWAIAAAWAAGFAVALSGSKPGGFEPESQRMNQTRFLVLREGAPSCADNPLFCGAFTFRAEFACWRGEATCPGRVDGR